MGVHFPRNVVAFAMLLAVLILIMRILMQSLFCHLICVPERPGVLQFMGSQGVGHN